MSLFFLTIQISDLRSPHVKKMLPSLCNAHNANADPVTSFFANAPHMAALQNEVMSKKRTYMCIFYKQTFLQYSRQLIDRHQDHPN